MASVLTAIFIIGIVHILVLYSTTSSSVNVLIPTVIVLVGFGALTLFGLRYIATGERSIERSGAMTLGSLVLAVMVFNLTPLCDAVANGGGILPPTVEWVVGVVHLLALPIPVVELQLHAPNGCQVNLFANPYLVGYGLVAYGLWKEPSLWSKIGGGTR